MRWFTVEIPKRANKAPEPTTFAVTARATESVFEINSRIQFVMLHEPRQRRSWLIFDVSQMISFRSRVIGQCFVAWLGTTVLLCIMLDAQLEAPWLSRVIAPLCLFPAVSLAGYLAHHLDKSHKAAFLIGAPTTVAMSSVAAFAFYIFSPVGERHLKSASFAVLALFAFGAAMSLWYGFAIRRAFSEKGH
jgi:hypothetical protein